MAAGGSKYWIKNQDKERSRNSFLKRKTYLKCSDWVLFGEVFHLEQDLFKFIITVGKKSGENSNWSSRIASLRANSPRICPDKLSYSWKIVHFGNISVSKRNVEVYLSLKIPWGHIIPEYQVRRFHLEHATSKNEQINWKTHQNEIGLMHYLFASW